MIESLFALILLGLIAWYWMDGLTAREIGIAAARQACAAEGVQFLDDTVAQSGIRVLRGGDGRLHLQRSFAFEYSLSGDDRQPGSVTLLAHTVTMLFTGTRRNDEELPNQLH